MENVLYWRRKLLDFDDPVEKEYTRIDIPRYYSSFYPWFKMEWNLERPVSPRKNICTGVYHETLDYPTLYNVYGHPNFIINWKLVLIVLVMIVLAFLYKK